MKLSKRVKVKNALGLHARPATIIARLLQKRQSKVSFSFHGETINPRSIMSVLMLAIGRNSQILITVEGEDAQVTLDTLVEAFDNQFGEVISEL